MPAMEKGPYLGTAVFCETAILGQDGAVSLIRIIDTVTQAAVWPDPPEAMPPFVVNSKLAIMLKAGEARGRYRIKLQPEAPDGRALPAQEQTIQLDGGGHTGVNVLIDVQFAVDLE